MEITMIQPDQWLNFSKTANYVEVTQRRLKLKPR